MVLLSLLAPVSRGLMVEIPYEQLWDETDTIALGTVTEITTHWGENRMIYQVATINVERYYKNPLNASTLYVRVEGGTMGNTGIWVEDQPEFTSGQRVLVFLASTDQTHNGQPLYTVYGSFQGVFTVTGDTVRAPGGPYLTVTEEGITLMPVGRMELAEFIIPVNRTIHEDIYITMGFTNPGGQTAKGNVTVTFTGLQGPCTGYTNTTTFWIGVGPGGYTGHELRANFTLPGTYTATVNGEPAANLTIHPAGYLSQHYTFTDLTFEPTHPAAGQQIKVTLTVSTTLKEETRCLYWMKIKQTQAQGTPMNPLSIYMASELNSTPQDTNWYEFIAQTPGTYKVTVWHRGTRVLQDNITVTAPQSQEDQPTPIPGHTTAATLLGLAAATTLKNINKLQRPHDDSHRQGNDPKKNPKHQNKPKNRET